MSAHALPSPRATPPSLRFVDRVVDLTQAFSPEVNAVVLRRDLDLANAAGTLAHRFPDRTWKAEVEPGPEPVELARALPDFPEVEPLLEDLAFLVDVFQTLLDTDRVGVRVATGSSPMCPAFHRDHLMMRLVVTYLGPATEALCASDLDPAASGALAPRDEGCIRRASAGDLVLLKGSAWPGNDGQGAVHRSPPQPDASPRVVATLDPLWRVS